MKNKLHARVAIGDWLTVNCRLVSERSPEQGDPDMVTKEELAAARKLLEEATPIEENDVDDFDIDYLL
jgi:hypothetical protein